jgi:patatin-like phospholipase/acyl hydrolase
LIDEHKQTLTFADGGGTRGYASLLILQQLVNAISVCENRIEAGNNRQGPSLLFDPQDLQLNDYFNYMYGTSTGDIIAAMLGRLNMTVPRCLEEFWEVSDGIFGHRRLISYVTFVTKYSGKTLKKETEQVVRKHCTEHAPCDGRDAFATKTGCTTYVG